LTLGMSTNLPHSQNDLRRIYAQRFSGNQEYRRKIWRILIRDFFGRLVQPAEKVLDLGCGYGEFINEIDVSQKFAMDLNSDAARFLKPGIEFICQDCSQPWPIAPATLDTVFSSNFFEHLPDKATLGRTLDQIRLALKPEGVLIAMGPNIKHLPGNYWDFWDHYLPLTELSLGEALENRGFAITRSTSRFLPYTMAVGVQYPPVFLSLYLRLPWAWHVFGRQFLVVARK
jgi:SAM-dependent methyltransferase